MPALADFGRGDPAMAKRRQGARRSVLSTDDMTDDVPQAAPETPAPEMPRVEPPAPPVPAATAPSQGGHVLEGVTGLRDTIFEKLVSGENDVVGLLAYSLSMQNKRDWLAAFKAEAGRDPTSAEMAAYDIGERIERRLTTYRKLAEHALSGNSFWASASLTPVSELPGAPVADTSAPAAAPSPSFAQPRRSGGRSFGMALLIIAGAVGVLAAATLTARHFLGV